MVKVKDRHISTVNISKMEKDIANITISIKYAVRYGLSVDILRFDVAPFKMLRSRSCAFTLLKYDRANITTVIKRQDETGLSVSIFTFDLCPF